MTLNTCHGTDYEFEVLMYCGIWEVEGCGQNASCTPSRGDYRSSPRRWQSYVSSELHLSTLKFKHTRSAEGSHANAPPEKPVNKGKSTAACTLVFPTGYNPPSGYRQVLVQPHETRLQKPHAMLRKTRNIRMNPTRHHHCHEYCDLRSARNWRKTWTTHGTSHSD